MKTHNKLMYIFLFTSSLLIANIVQLGILDEDKPGYRKPSSNAEYDLTWDYWGDISIGSSDVVLNYGAYDGQSNVLQVNHDSASSGNFAIGRGTFQTPLDKDSIEFQFALGTQTGSQMAVFARNSNEQLLFGILLYPDNRIKVYDCQTKYFAYTVDSCTNWVNIRIEFDSSNQRYDLFCEGVKFEENLLYYSYYVSSDSTAVDMIVYTDSTYIGDYDAYLNNVVVGSVYNPPTTPPDEEEDDPPVEEEDDPPVEEEDGPPVEEGDNNPQPEENPSGDNLNIVLSIFSGAIIIGLVGYFAVKGKRKPTQTTPVVLVTQTVVEKHYIPNVSQNYSSNDLQGKLNTKPPVSILYCSHCGFENSGSDLFCIECGSKL